MHALKELETKQIGLRLSKHLVNEVDDLISDYDINRSTFITEAITDFVAKQKEKIFYDGLEEAVKEMKMMMDGDLPKTTLDDLINELDYN
jgi:predicted transcriptional regulator